VGQLIGRGRSANMKEVINSIRKVSIEVSKWFGYATAVVDGIEVDQSRAPQNNSMCQFGQWYDKDEWNLSSFEEYAQIGHHHLKLHALFDEMMEIVNKEQKSSFLNKLAGASSQMPKKYKKILFRKYQDFKHESELLLSLLKMLQVKVDEMEQELAA